VSIKYFYQIGSLGRFNLLSAMTQFKKEISFCFRFLDFLNFQSTKIPVNQLKFTPKAEFLFGVKFLYA
jgi:hypothetical protein